MKEDIRDLFDKLPLSKNIPPDSMDDTPQHIKQLEDIIRNYIPYLERGDITDPTVLRNIARIIHELQRLKFGSIEPYIVHLADLQGE